MSPFLISSSPPPLFLIRLGSNFFFNYFKWMYDSMAECLANISKTPNSRSFIVV